MKQKPPSAAKQTTPDDAELLDEALADDVLTAEGLGADEWQSPTAEFFREVNVWVQKWLDSHDDAECSATKPCIFAFIGDQDAMLVDGAVSHAPSFSKVYDHEVSGHLFLSSLALRTVHEAHKGFVSATAALSWVQGNLAAEMPCVVFVPRERKVLIHESGQDLDDCQVVEFRAMPAGAFSFSQLDDLLLEFHERWTKTHQGYCRVWARPKARELKPLPEGQIQGSLMAFFDFYVRPHGAVVDEEFFTRSGRGDVRIIRRVRGRKVASGADEFEACVLELKVLSVERGRIGNVKWAKSGVDQALDYRNSQPYPGPSYLCCYDGRWDDVDIQDVKDYAKAKNVLDRRYFMKPPSGAKAPRT
jgi:hypothetical protein